MKRQILASLSILLLSGATATSIKPALAAEQIQPTPAITIAQNQPVAIKSGTFVAAEKHRSVVMNLSEELTNARDHYPNNVIPQDKLMRF